MIGAEDSNIAGDRVGRIDDFLLTNGGTCKEADRRCRQVPLTEKPGSLVLRPRGNRHAAVPNMSKDMIAAAPPCDRAQMLTGPCRALHRSQHRFGVRERITIEA